MEDGFAQGYAVGKDSNNGGYGFGYGGDWIWIILLFVLCGNNGFGGGFGGNMGAFPWLLQGQANTDNNVNAGFMNASVSGKLDSISDAICDNEITTLRTSYENQIAGMNQSFAMQSAFDKCLTKIKDKVKRFASKIKNLFTFNTVGTCVA